MGVWWRDGSKPEDPPRPYRVSDELRPFHPDTDSGVARMVNLNVRGPPCVPPCVGRSAACTVGGT